MGAQCGRQSQLHLERLRLGRGRAGQRASEAAGEAKTRGAPAVMAHQPRGEYRWGPTQIAKERPWPRSRGPGPPAAVGWSAFGLLRSPRKRTLWPTGQDGDESEQVQCGKHGENSLRAPAQLQQPLSRRLRRHKRMPAVVWIGHQPRAVPPVFPSLRRGACQARAVKWATHRRACRKRLWLLPRRNWSPCRPRRTEPPTPHHPEGPRP